MAEQAVVRKVVAFPKQKRSLSLAQQIKRDQQLAKRLRQVVGEENWAVNLGTSKAPREHLRVEAWATLGSWLGLTSKIREDYTTEGEIGARTYTVYCEVLREADGVVIGGAIGTCGPSEPRWCSKPKYKDGKCIGTEAVTDQHRLGMASTRAQSRALSMRLRFIAVLAKFEGAPAEEMNGGAVEQEPAPEQQSGHSVATKRIVTDKQIAALREAFRKSGMSDQDFANHFKVSVPALRATIATLGQTEYQAAMRACSKAKQKGNTNGSTANGTGPRPARSEGNGVGRSEHLSQRSGASASGRGSA